MMKLNGATGVSDIILGDSLTNLGNYCNSEKIVIVTDVNVRALHGHLFSKADLLEIGVGEESKTLETITNLYEKFLELELDRSSCVVGIGGGIVCDVVGFAASTYLRGMRFGFVPTTLLAQVDASIGGKNGVNFKGYKNLVGVFRQPEFVLCDFDLLKTLPGRELRCGFAEIIKHSVIGDGSLFSYLEMHFSDAFSLKKTAIEKVVHDSLTVKAKIVGADEFEQTGERMKLNFGHTIGHAVEKACSIPHGEAVSIGMVAAANISVNRGLLKKQDADRLISLLNKLELPTQISSNKEKIVDAIRKDKKRRGDELSIVLLESIGKAVITKIKIQDLEVALNELC